MTDAPTSVKVLLVDDEKEFLETLVKRLAKRGFDVSAVFSGQDALDRLAAQAVDVVVMDVRMPGLDGIETLRRLKAAHPTIEVIMLTGHASLEAAIEGMDIGAFDYLMKPMEMSDLIYKIQDAYKKKRLQEERGPGQPASDPVR